MITAWDKIEVVEGLENNAFHNENYKNGFLFRESDNYIIQELKKIFQPGMVLIDYACGTGRLVEVMRANGIKVTKDNYIGFDFTPAMIEKAKEKFSELIFTNNIDDIKDKTFDILVNIDMLQHCASVSEMKKNIKAMTDISKKSIFHFWYSPVEKKEILNYQDSFFNEYFPCLETVLNDLTPEAATAKIKTFACISSKFDKSIYPCVVISLTDVIKIDLEEEKTEEPEETKATEKKGTKKKKE